MTSILFCFALLISVILADNFCRTQSDFNPSTVAVSTTTCSALSTYLLGKVPGSASTLGSPSTWSAVSCNQVFETSWTEVDYTQSPPSTVSKNIAEHLWAYGTACCGSAYKTLLGTTCYGCSNVGGVGQTVDSMGWYSATGSSTWQVASPGAGIKTGAGTGLGPGSFCPIKPTETYAQTNDAGVTCNIAAWTNKKHGDTTADAAYSTCGSCTVLISKTTPNSYSTCDAYCAAQQGGLVCAGAWDEVLDSCLKKTFSWNFMTCRTHYSSDSDIMCKCCPGSGCPTSVNTTSGSSKSSRVHVSLVVGFVGVVAAVYGVGIVARFVGVIFNLVFITYWLGWLLL